MIRIAWRILRRSPGTLAGALVMTALGSALLSAFLVLHDSIDRTRAPVERYAGADVVVAGEDGLLTAELVDSLSDLPGVDEAVPELSFPASVLDTDGAPLIAQEERPQTGHAWTSASLTPMRADEGTGPRTDGAVVVDRALAEAAGAEVGDDLTVDVAGTARTYELAGLATGPDGDDLAHQHTLYFHPEEAERLAERGDGRVDAAGLTLEPGADASETAARARTLVSDGLAGDAPVPSGSEPFHVAVGADRGELEGTWPDHSATAAALTLLVWIVAFMAAAVIAGALITSVRRRAEQVALLRAIGATPRQVRLLCHGEALLISVVAAAVGCLLGLALAQAMVGVFRELGLVSSVLALRIGAEPLITSPAVTVLVAQVASWAASRSALRIRPGDALGGTPVRGRGPWRTRIQMGSGVLLLVAAGTLQALGMAGLVPPVLYASYGMIAAGLIIAGIGLLGAWAIHACARALRRPVAAAAGVGGHLAAANVRFYFRRYAGVAAPLAVGVAIAGWALSGLPLFALGNADQVAERFDADRVLNTPVVRDQHLGLSEETRNRVAADDGVTATAGLRETWAHVRADDSEVPVRAGEITRLTLVEGEASGLLDLGAVDGDLALVETGEGVAVGASHAGNRGLELGDEVELRVSGATEVSVHPVVAVYEHDDGGQDGLLASASALQGQVAGGRHDFVLAAEDSAAAATPVTGEARAEDPERFHTTYVHEREGAIDNLGTVATALVGVFLVLAAVNALAVSASARRSELASMRRLDLTTRQINAMVGWEMALTVVPAWLLGTAATAWMALAMAGGDVGAALWAFPWAVLSAVGVLGLTVAVAGARAATRGLLRSLPV
ncbi:FtsX-like permease family protein [Nocardiopsis sp. HNM0947]|uniref:FtsX-like permease family protein n=1 Tax=Nocardiopsis coralli TaxID=2772213 RepID=A0ABR9P669_9ACTN|nr:FtsX-like permease family protein [Nocardiopsis coralli]MBE2999195.1 FtsX-like permease family protein [Nocardiopsis coralli]